MDGARHLIIGAIAVLGIVALVAWARNGPGVGGREPDPPAPTVVVVVERPPSSAPDATTPPATVPDAPPASTTGG